MSHTLLLTQALPEPGMRLLAARTDVRVTVLAAPTAQALAAALPRADGVIVVMEEPALTAAMIGAAQRLRVACRCGAGYDNIDVAALTARGVPLVTTGPANADTVAEHALYLMLALARRGPRLDRAVKAGAWPREFGAIELRDRTCLVVGYGSIGRHVARLTRAFPMHVLVVDPGPGADTAAQDGSTVVATLAEALPQADVVVLACALTPATRGLIDGEALARMKQSAFLVNVARGAVVDEAALVAALEAGRLAGAGLDVLQTEPPLADNPLLTRDDVVLTPHTAAYVATAYDRMAVTAAEKTLAGLDGRLQPQDIVNPEAFETRI
jgi:D-3-phosphoglycerate dehydrogenase